MAAKWSPAQRAVWSEPFPPLRVLSWNGPQAVKGAPLLGAAQRTLDGEDRSEMITEEGKAGRTFGEKWSAILVPSPAASNKWREERWKWRQRDHVVNGRVEGPVSQVKHAGRDAPEELVSPFNPFLCSYVFLGLWRVA